MGPTRQKIYLFVFFLALAEALVFSVNSPFIANLISGELVGTVYSLASLSAILLLGLLPFFIRRAGPAGVLSALLFAGALVAFAVAYWPTAAILGALVIFLAIPQVAPAVSDIFIESSSRPGERGRVIGSEFTFMNLAFVIAPIIGGFIITRLGFNTLYAVSGAVFLLALLLSLRFTRHLRVSRLHTGHFWKGLGRAWRNRNLRNVLTTQFLLQFFFSWMVIYTPLYLIDKFALGYSTLGIIFSIMLIPYVILEYPLGKIADNKIGEKELLVVGFVLTAFTTAVIPLIETSSIWIWAIILFGTRVGAAMIEGMSATYFYKKADAEDIDLIALFRDMRPVAYILGPLLASLIIFEFSMGSLFPILGLIMLTGALIATRLRDTR
ncbi:MAG: MFS transporter [Patescibacteria group bacterium]